MFFFSSNKEWSIKTAVLSVSVQYSEQELICIEKAEDSGNASVFSGTA